MLTGIVLKSLVDVELVRPPHPALLALVWAGGAQAVFWVSMPLGSRGLSRVPGRMAGVSFLLCLLHGWREDKDRVSDGTLKQSSKLILAPLTP